jgi:lysophospholipid acyltransferase (LPLAT)-like uncharacterized protein
MPMSFFRKLRWNLIGILGKLALWIWAKSTRMKIIGQERYKELRDKGKAVIFLVWHGRIFIAHQPQQRWGVPRSDYVQMGIQKLKGLKLACGH